MKFPRRIYTFPEENERPRRAAELLTSVAINSDRSFLLFPLLQIHSRRSFHLLLFSVTSRPAHLSVTGYLEYCYIFFSSQSILSFLRVWLLISDLDLLMYLFISFQMYVPSVWAWKASLYELKSWSHCGSLLIYLIYGILFWDLWFRC